MATKLHPRAKNPKCISKLMKSKLLIFHFVLLIIQLLVLLRLKNSNMGKLDQVCEQHVDSL